MSEPSTTQPQSPASDQESSQQDPFWLPALGFVLILLIALFCSISPKTVSAFFKKPEVPTPVSEIIKDPNFEVDTTPIHFIDPSTNSGQPTYAYLEDGSRLPSTVASRSTFADADCFSLIGMHFYPGGNIKACLAETEQAAYGSWLSQPCNTAPYIKRYEINSAKWWRANSGLLRCVYALTHEAQTAQASQQFQHAIAVRETSLQHTIDQQRAQSERARTATITRTVCQGSDSIAYYAAYDLFGKLVDTGTTVASIRHAWDDDVSQQFDDVAGTVCQG